MFLNVELFAFEMKLIYSHVLIWIPWIEKYHLLFKNIFKIVFEIYNMKNVKESKQIPKTFLNTEYLLIISW